MAIKKEALKRVLISLKIGNDSEIDELINSAEEKDISVPEGVKIFTNEDYIKLLENQKTEGIKVGKEISIKELKEAVGLDFEGKKPETFIESYRKKVIEEAGIKPDEKLKERDTTISELRTKLKAEQEKALTATKKGEQAEKDAKLLTLFPQTRSQNLTDDDRLTLIKKRFEFTVEDGKEGVKDIKTGKYIQNDTLENLGWQSVLDKHFTDSKWIDDEGGKSPDNPSGPGLKGSKKVGGIINSMREFREYCNSNNMNLNGEDAQAKLAEVTKANPDFNFNEN